MSLVPELGPGANCYCHTAGLKNQQQSQGYQQLLVCVFPEQEKQQNQKQKISGVHMVQVKLVQDVLQKTGETVGRPAAASAGRRAPRSGTAEIRASGSRTAKARGSKAGPIRRRLFRA